MTNDTVPTLTTTNHLHIPTLFMHQTRVQTPNLNLSMPWHLGPDHHVDVQHKQIQPNKQHGPSDSLVRDRSSGTKRKKNASHLQCCNYYLWIDICISSSRWSKLYACLAWWFSTHCHYSVAEWERPRKSISTCRQWRATYCADGTISPNTTENATKLTR